MTGGGEEQLTATNEVGAMKNAFTAVKIAVNVNSRLPASDQWSVVSDAAFSSTMSLMASGGGGGAMMTAGVGHAVVAPLPTMPSLPGGGGAASAAAGGGITSEQLFDEHDRDGGTEMPVGIHIGEEALRLAGWDAGAGKATALPADADSAGGSLRACACYVRPGQVLLGGDVDLAWREQPHHTLLRPVRLLGRSFSSLGGARWLADEEAHTPCSLVPDADELSYSAGRARFRLSHERASSDLRKRAGAQAAPKAPGAKKPSAKIETDVAPEEALQKLLRRALGSAAKACGGAAPTHAVLAVGAGANLAARQAAADAATMAGLDVVCVVTETAALVAESTIQLALNKAGKSAGAAALALVWGAGSFAASVLLREEADDGGLRWRVAATTSDARIGVTGLDRALGGMLLAQLEDDDEVSGIRIYILRIPSPNMVSVFSIYIVAALAFTHWPSGAVSARG